jgi:lipopolysaccharide assembly outer membrane protein LptD (OstA)
MINFILKSGNMKKTVFILILATYAFFLSASPQKQDKKEEIKILTTGKTEYLEDKIIYNGVEFIFDEYRIYADYVEYDVKSKDIIAQGRVTMSSGDTVITGERLTFNLNEKSGIMYDTYGQMPPTIRYTTDELKQVDNETLTFKKLNFTSCTQCVPRWVITCTKGKIKKEKYIEMKNFLFKIKKIPVFYFPYLRYPVTESGRATGILFPKPGFSDLRGFYILNSFYWAMKRNLDLTISFDYYANAGVGLAEEFRYLFRKMEGNLKFYYFKYKKDNILESQSESDYLLKMAHKQKINFLNTKISVAIDRQSDANFLRLFSNDFYSVLRRISRSSVSIDSSFYNLKLNISGMQNDTYYTFNNKSMTLRYLPTVKLNLNQQKIWKIPGYFSFLTSFSNVSRIGKSYSEEETIYTTDVTSKRINLNPFYSLKMLNLTWLNATLQLSSKHSFYPKSLAVGDRKTIVDEPLHLGYNSAKLVVKGPVLSKIYEFKNSKIKHLIEPKITFNYVTKLEQKELARLIPVDYFDYPSYSYIGLSLDTRLLYKNKTGKASAREILSYTLKQEYFFDPLLANRGRKVTGIYPEFSEFSNTLRLRPFKDFSVDSSVKYNFYLKKLTRLRFTLAYQNKNSFLHGNFTYSTYVNQYAKPDYVFNRDLIGGELFFDIPTFPIKFRSIVNYDITQGEFRHGSFLVSFDYQCIRFNTELRLFKFTGRVETQFNFGVTFGNLGMVKDFLGIED